MSDDAHLARRALAVGVFDLFHVGHLRYLQWIRQRSQILLVAVTQDATVLAKKQRRPIVCEAQRIEMITGLGWVDQVFAQPTSLDDTDAVVQWMSALAIDHVFIGEDWMDSLRWQRLAPRLMAQGIALTWTPRSDEISTILLRQRVSEQAQR